MKVVIVDDEPIMIRSFCRYANHISGLEIVGQFEDSLDAYDYMRANPIDVVFLDIEMPGLGGLELAKRLKTFNPDLLIVFITAYENYIKDANEMGADYYIVKPYKEETLQNVVNKLKKLLPARVEKDIYIRTFGRFAVLKQGDPIPLVGKTKEILALIVSRRGKEISNEELYTTIWENREYDNVHMKVYYNALKRLRDILDKAGISNLITSTSRGQMLNTEVCDCDYISWMAGSMDERDKFEGEFLSEYSWAEPLLAELLETKTVL